jgi:hypothetical protein
MSLNNMSRSCIIPRNRHHRASCARAILVVAVAFLVVRAAETWSATIVNLPPIGPQPVVVSPQGKQTPLYQESHALLVSASNYTSWRTLPETATDMDNVATALRKQGFSVRRVSNPSSTELGDVFRSFVGDHGRSTENRLLLFFSGHGYTAPSKGIGYLVPVDAPDPRNDPSGFYRKAYPITTLNSLAQEIDSRHALFLFDSCFSGSIFKTKAHSDAPGSRGSTVSERWRYLRDNAVQPVRQFIAAGGPDEELPAQSVFVPLFIKALEGHASTAGDGYVTGKEIGLWIEQELPKYRRQKPHSDVIKDPGLAFGDVIFQFGSPGATTSSTTTSATLPRRKSALDGEVIIVHYHPTRAFTALELATKLEEFNVEVSVDERDILRSRDRLTVPYYKVQAARFIEQETSGEFTWEIIETNESAYGIILIQLGPQRH